MSQAPETRGGAAVAGVAAVKGGSILQRRNNEIMCNNMENGHLHFFEKWTSNFEMSDCFKLRFIFL